MSQVNPIPGEQSAVAVSCPCCGGAIRLNVRREKRSYSYLCQYGECKRPLFLDRCEACESWNAIEIRAGQRVKCVTDACTNFFDVRGETCPKCREHAVCLTSSEFPERTFCSRCRKDDGSRKPATSVLDLDPDNLLPPASGEKPRGPARSIYSSGNSGPTEAPAPAPPQPAIRPVVREMHSVPATGQPAPRPPGPLPDPQFLPGLVKQGFDRIESRLVQLAGQLERLDSSGEDDDIAQAANSESAEKRQRLTDKVLLGDKGFDAKRKWQSGDSELAKSFRELEQIILGPSSTDAGSKAPAGQPRQWLNLPSALRQIVGKSLKQISADVAELTQRLDAQTSRPAADKRGRASDSRTESEAGGENLAPALDMIHRVQNLNVNLLDNLPGLFDVVEGSVASYAARFADDANSAGPLKLVRQIEASVERNLDDWMAKNDITKVNPAPGDVYDEALHERERDEPTNDPEQGGKICSTFLPGYVFDDGRSRVVLRKPRVIVWYLE